LVQLKTSPNDRGSKNQYFPAKLNSAIKIERENNNKTQTNRDTCYYVQNLDYYSNPATEQDTCIQITLQILLSMAKKNYA